MTRRGFASRKDFGAWRRRRAFALLVGALALFMRVALADPCPPEVSPQSDALATLATLTGDSAVLCAHAESDGAKKPTQSSDCCAGPCFQACYQMPAPLPGAASMQARPILASAAMPLPLPTPPGIPPVPRAAQPRGPPISV